MARDDGTLVRVAPLLELAGDCEWEDFLGEGVSAEDAAEFRRHERTGRPLGAARFLTLVEQALARLLRPRRPARKPKRQ